MITSDKFASQTKFGRYGGQYVSETLMHALNELESEFNQIQKEPQFQQKLKNLLENYSGRPTPLTYAKRLTTEIGGGKIYLKREDLNHTGAHKINNTLGQALLAKRMGKKKIVAETGAGQHGVASATAAALLGMECSVFMGAEDVRRQQLNVFRMELLGARVIPVESGSQTLKDATNEAIRYWVTHVTDTFYMIGSVVGPHPYPQMVKTFQRVIGDEARAQIMKIEGRLPDHVVACVGGGSNAIGMFTAFLHEPQVQLHGIEAGGIGSRPGEHAAALSFGRPGVLHGALSYLLQTEDGQIQPAHSISAGLDYPGVGPEHAFLKEQGAARYTYASDEEALAALRLLSQKEGILPALESAHAIAEGIKIAAKAKKDDIIIICLSGRGDKDVETIQQVEEGKGNEAH